MSTSNSSPSEALHDRAKASPFFLTHIYHPFLSFDIFCVEKEGVLLSLKLEDGDGVNGVRLYSVGGKGESGIVAWIEAFLQNKEHPLPAIQEEQALFSRHCREALLSIPSGKTATYLTLAEQVKEKMGSNKNPAPRAVGNFCRLNFYPLLIPCHRVLPRAGGVGNYAFGSHIKEQLLRHERLISPHSHCCLR